LAFKKEQGTKKEEKKGRPRILEKHGGLFVAFLTQWVAQEKEIPNGPIWT